MGQQRQTRGGPIKERVWNIAQAVLAPLLVAVITSGAYVVAGYGDRVGKNTARLDVELEPIDGKRMRDMMIDVLHQLNHGKMSAHNLSNDVQALETSTHQQIESVAKLVSELNHKCMTIQDKCEYSMKSIRQK